MRMFYTPICLVTLYIFINNSFIFENHIKHTPYTIGTKYSPKLATTTIFVKSVSIFLQVRYKDKPRLTTSRSTIKSRFIHLLLVLLLSGQVELNPGPITPNQSSTLSTNYPCGICQKKVNDSHHALLCDKCELWFHTDCLVLKDHPNRLPSLLHWIFTDQMLFLGVNQNYVIQCAVMNSSLGTTPSFVKIAM